GKVESGEDPRLGLQRELAEELGVEVKVGRIWEVVSVVKGDLHLILLYFDCKLVRGIPRAIDCQQVCWLSPDEVVAREKPAADLAFWEKHRQEFFRKDTYINSTN
ncbi:MAG TPA: NUDIX domain-containing protein, partial [Bacillota bacterium]|nr:NUDIX domain-containing protein [Bacillota bacterium]